MRAIFVIALCLCLAVPAVTYAGNETGKEVPAGAHVLSPKPATPATVAAQKALSSGLPTGDRQDYEFVRRGFIASVPGDKITDEKGRVVRDLSINNFLKSDSPDTVNPSLWRDARLLQPHGLFEVVDGVYQVRGFDLANMTIIRGKTGYIVIDTMMIAEAAKAGMDLVLRHLGDRPVKAVIYTHSHIDHYGGVKGVVSAADVASGKTMIIAPRGFMREVVGEFVIAGPAMNRRAVYQFGYRLPPGPTSAVTGGIGPIHPPTGTVALIPPTREIASTGETLTIDGVKLEFQMTPDTEAPAEMNIYLPDFRALCMAENANGCMHQFYPLRGAKVRDARLWAGKLTESIRLFAHRSDVVFASHFWPRWGQEVILDYLASHRDAYKYIHDQSVRLMNMGLTGVEIGEAIALPDSLAKRWFNRGNYGAWSQNARSVYQRYLGWYDGNPAHLHPLPPEEAARRYVVAMGGTDAVLARVREAADKGEYRWAAELADRVIFSDPGNRRAQLLQADILEQLGYQAESATWRNAYLSGAFELRNGPPKRPIAGMSHKAGDLPVPYLLDVMSVRLVPERVAGKRFKLNVNITNPKERYVLSLANSVLVYEGGVNDGNADATLTMDKPAFRALLSGQSKADALIAEGRLKVSGNCPFLNELPTFFQAPRANFNLVTP